MAGRTNLQEGYINLAIKLFDRLPYFYLGPSIKVIAWAIVDRTAYSLVLPPCDK